MIREEVKTNQMRLDHEVRFHHEQWTVWGVSKTKTQDPRGGGGVLPCKGLTGTCSQPGYVFRDFCLKQGIDFINFCLKQGIFSWTINSLRVYMFYECLKQGMKIEILSYTCRKISDFCLKQGQGIRGGAGPGRTSIPKDISSTPPPPGLRPNTPWTKTKTLWTKTKTPVD